MLAADALSSPEAALRDLASIELWERSIRRSRQRRRLAAEARRRAPRRKGASVALTATMVVVPSVPKLAFAAAPAGHGHAKTSGRGPAEAARLILLREGAQGHAVAALQRQLNAQLGSRLAVDGIFGPRTARAVAAFQQHRSLRATRQVDSPTWLALFPHDSVLVRSTSAHPRAHHGAGGPSGGMVAGALDTAPDAGGSGQSGASAPVAGVPVVVYHADYSTTLSHQSVPVNSVWSGRASLFNDTRTASGRHGGISTHLAGGLNGYWLLRAPNGRTLVQRQNDLGPAGWTHRLFDITPGVARAFGYGGTDSTFPTDQGTWTGTFLGSSNRASAASRRATGSTTALKASAQPRRAARAAIAQPTVVPIHRSHRSSPGTSGRSTRVARRAVSTRHPAAARHVMASRHAAPANRPTGAPAQSQVPTAGSGGGANSSGGAEAPQS